MTQDMFPWEEEQHYYRHKVEVHLALMAVDGANIRFAVYRQGDTNSLPWKVLQRKGSSFATVKKLFKEITGGDVEPWFPIKQVGAFDQTKDDVIIILYAVFMPGQVPFLDPSVSWVDYETISKHPSLLEMMGKACNYYRANT